MVIHTHTHTKIKIKREKKRKSESLSFNIATDKREVASGDKAPHLSFLPFRVISQKTDSVLKQHMGPLLFTSTSHRLILRWRLFSSADPPMGPLLLSLMSDQGTCLPAAQPQDRPSSFLTSQSQVRSSGASKCYLFPQPNSIKNKSLSRRLCSAVSPCSLHLPKASSPLTGAPKPSLTLFSFQGHKTICRSSLKSLGWIHLQSPALSYKTFLVPMNGEIVTPLNSRRGGHTEHSPPQSLLSVSSGLPERIDNNLSSWPLPKGPMSPLQPLCPLRIPKTSSHLC